jgi:xanthine/CO dehydrogenase XdhC/CoxF family maturation factor
MKEINDIVAAYDRAVKQGKKTALATVVLVEGSAYRRAGARMLITEDGQLTGAISGGCLEGDALRKARMVILQQEALLVTYDTMDDDDAKLGIGLGCNGIIHILIEPISGNAENPIALLKKIIAAHGDTVLVTLFSIENRRTAQPGTCICLTQGDLITTQSDIPFRDELIRDVRAVLVNRQSQNNTHVADVCYTAFIEYVKPLISLVIIGAGNDAVPLTKLASVLGWDITVVDGRNNYALPERFPYATKVVVSRPENVLSHIKLNDRTAFVLMTHNYNYEIELLKTLLPIDMPYVGILGPKKKLQRMLDEIEESGAVINKGQLVKIYGPVGLDIGSEGPEEIALSIVAEIKTVLSGRKGYSLKYKPVPIHSERLSVNTEQ